MPFLLTRLRVPLTWREVFKRALYEAFWKDNCLALAAQLAYYYYFFFALFPTLLFMVALASYFPLTTLIDDLFRTMGGLMPPEALQLITNQMIKISEDKQTGLLTLGVLLAISSSSAAMVAIIDTLNNAYDVDEGRPWWRVRLTAIALTTGVAIFILVSFALVLVGPTVATRLAETMGSGAPVFEWTWKILQWPVLFGLASFGFALIYYFAPDVEQEWVWLTPGSIFATTLWLAASLGFKYYVANWGHYTETYGLIGAVMILLLWFYISRAGPAGGRRGERGDRARVAAREGSWRKGPRPEAVHSCQGDAALGEVAAQPRRTSAQRRGGEGGPANRR